MTSREVVLSSKATEELKNLLGRRVRMAREEALRLEGQVPREQVETLDNLARLIEIDSGMHRPKPHNPWRVVAALAGTLAVVTILLSARLSDTEIELEARTSELGFGLLAAQGVSDGMELEDLLLSCSCEIHFPETRDRESLDIAPAEGESVAIRLTTHQAGGKQGSISVAGVTLPAGAAVRLMHSGTPGKYRLSLQGERIALRINVYGPVKVTLPGEGPRVVDFAIPEGIPIQSASAAVTLDVRARQPGNLGLSPQIAVGELAFSRMEEVAGVEEYLVRRVSTVVAGTLYLEALNGKERSLRPAEPIELEGVRGEVGGVKLGESDIVLRFHGRVTGLASGWGENRRNLMPTWLEWLRERHGLKLLWGTTFYLFGLLLGALRWLKVTF